MLETVTSNVERIIWRLKDLPPVTGFGMPFWRKAIRLKRIKFHRPAGSNAIVIFHSDLIEFLRGKEGGD